jgi:transposase
MVYDFLVALPTKKVILKKIKTSIYVYYNVCSFRNKKGQPSSVQVSIGRLDKSTGKLYPNQRYFDYFPDNKPDYLPTQARKIAKETIFDSEQQSITFADYGEVAVLKEIARQTGLLEILKKCFPTKWKRMLVVAFYMISRGNVMSYINYWFDATHVGFSNPMSDVDCSRLFESITESEMSLFFIEWLKYHGERDYIAYDVTSMSTQSVNISNAEWGYNRDGDKLAQLNFGMFYGVTRRIPVYYDLYNGSIPDVAYLEHMVLRAKDFGINKLCFVFDRGFLSNDNLTFLLDNGFSFITAMPSHLQETMNLIDKVKFDIVKHSNKIDGFEIFGVKENVEINGRKLTAHVCFNNDKKTLEIREILSHVNKLEKELIKINKSKKLSKRFSNYFVIEEQSKSTIKYKLDERKIDERLSRAGFYILLCVDSEITTGEVVKTYKERNVIEVNFNQLKNDLDFRRLKTHYDKTTDGKVFVGFLALILRSSMVRMIKGHDITKKYTCMKVQLELRKIRLITMTDKSKILSKITKTQKDILEALNIKYENFLYMITDR